MKSTTDGKTMDAAMRRILELLAQGRRCFQEAGNLLVQQIDAGRDVYGWLADKPEAKSQVQLFRLVEDIGRGRLHPLLLLDSGRPWVALARKLPLAQQTKILEEKVEMVIETTAGTDVLLVDADALNREQAEQLLHGGRLHSCAEQKVWLAARTAAKEAQNAKPWRILKGGKVEIRCRCILTGRELEEIKQEIKSRGRA